MSLFGGVSGTLSFPAPVWAAGHGWVLAFSAVMASSPPRPAVLARRRFEATGKPRATVLPGLLLISCRCRHRLGIERSQHHAAPARIGRRGRRWAFYEEITTNYARCWS
jgi:hypothetical protein